MADEKAAAMVVGLSATKRNRVRVLVRRGLEQGWNDDTLAARIEATVGLDARYTQAVENYRQTLIKNGTAPGRARALARAYADRLRDHRAHVIARTEVHSALLEAQRRLWTEAQEAGDLTPYAVRITKVRPNGCDKCRSQNGRRGSLKAGSKGGPPFHPQCRCYEVLEDQGVVKSMAEIEKGRKGRLNWSPKSNWVEEEGGLPAYMEDIAVAIMRDHGYSRERAIKIAVNRCKMWAAGGGDVNADTRAKAAKAVAQWEAMKARRKG